MPEPEFEVTKEAIARFEARFEYAREHYFTTEEGRGDTSLRIRGSSVKGVK